MKKLRGFEKGYLGLHAVQLKAVIGDAVAKSGLLRDNDEVAGKMEGFECLPETAIPFKMKTPFKPHMVDAQLVNGDGVVVEPDLPKHVDGKLGYIELPGRRLPPGSYTVRGAIQLWGHLAGVR